MTTPTEGTMSEPTPKMWECTKCGGACCTNPCNHSRWGQTCQCGGGNWILRPPPPSEPTGQTLRERLERLQTNWSASLSEEEYNALTEVLAALADAQPEVEREPDTEKFADDFALDVVQSIADSMPTDATETAQELLKGSEVEHLFCLEAATIQTFISIAIQDALTVGALYRGRAPSGGEPTDSELYWRGRAMAAEGQLRAWQDWPPRESAVRRPTATEIAWRNTPAKEPSDG